MIIHSPKITGSLAFPREDGTEVVLQISTDGALETIELDSTGSQTTNKPASNLSGSFTGSFLGDGSNLTGVSATGLNIDGFSAGTLAGEDEILFSDTSDSGNEKRATFQSGLNAIGVLSGSSQAIDILGSLNSYTSSNDTNQTNQNSRLENLESFTSSLDDDYVTQTELASATGSIETEQTAQDSRLSNLEGATGSYQATLSISDSAQVDLQLNSNTLTANLKGGVVSGSSQIVDVLDSLNSYTASNDTTNSTQNSRLNQLSTETGSISDEQGIQDGRLDNLESFTSSVDTDDVSEGSSNLYYTDARVKTKLNAETVISGSGQITITESQISDLSHYTDSDVKTKLNSDLVVSGSSSQVRSFLNIADGATNYGDSDVKTKLNSDLVVSGSATNVRSFLNVADGANNYSHPSITATANTSTASPSHGGTFTALDSVTVNSNGHVTAYNTKTVTLPSDNNTDVDVSITNLESRLGEITNDITIGDATDVDVTFAGGVVVSGNLTVSGTTTTVNSNTVNIGDNIIVLNSDVTGTPSQNGGIEIERGTSDNASVTWDESNDYWSAGIKGSEVQIALVNGTYSGLRAQSTTAGDVGLGNVTNESKATMFSSPTFTGTVSGVTKSHVGLGNVENTALSTYTGQGGALDNQYITNGAGYITSYTNTNQLTTFQVEDGDGTEVTISHGKEWKFVEGTGIDINWTDTSNGTDGDPYDLTITNTAPFTGDVFDNDGTYASLRAQGTTKGDVGLGNVENTALSTWAGSTNITTLGTISTGTWNGSVIGDAYLSSNTAHLSGTQTFSGAKTFSAAVNISDSTASTTKTSGALIVTGGVGISGALNVGGDVVAYASSDERLKDNIELISNPIEKVQSLKGVTWNWNNNADELQQSLPNVGVIAQDVEKVLPQLVHDRDNGFKGVDYAKLTGLLIEAIKEQQKQIDELKSKIQ